MKLTQTQIGLLKLIGRSPVKEDGWRDVSEICCKLFEKKTLPDELYEFEKLGMGGRVRLTESGEILLEYS